MTDTKEISISFTKSLFSAIPYVGQILNEVAFDFRSRIKQNRLNKFTEILTEFFEISNDIKIENLKTEEFSDLFESVLRRVTQTQSEIKHQRFKNILVHQIQNPQNNIDTLETYLDLLTSLSEMEITILKHHAIFDDEFENRKNKFNETKSELIQKQDSLKQELDLLTKGFSNSYSKIENEISDLQFSVDTYENEIDQLQKFRSSSFYNITKNDFLYYKQSLYSKALLIDNGIGAIGVHPFQIMGITEFGKKLIQYILN